MDQHERADRLNALVNEADSLAESLRSADGETGSKRRDAHRLREVLGVALVLAEGVAKDAGNDSMLTLETRDDTGKVRYRVVLDESDFAELNPS